MNCDEFLRLFREALDGKVSDQIINDNINYYRSYIQSEVRKGRSEEEVIRSLGDPRLLAKTTEESTKFAEGANGSGAYYEYDNDTGRYEDADERSRFNVKQIKLPSWLVGIIVLVVVIIVLVVVFQVAFFLAPYIIAFMIVGFIYRGIRNWINRY